MKLAIKIVAVGLAAAGVAACTSGQSAIEPPRSNSNPIGTSTLQFAVGTAAIDNGFGGDDIGLNTIVTLRQPNGASAVLLDVPVITGPGGFVVPSAIDAGVDGGTNQISGRFKITGQPAPPPTTFGSIGGAFGFGFQPSNSTTSGSPHFGWWFLPFYPNADNEQYVGGPPQFPRTTDGTYPSAFKGFQEGFTDFNIGGSGGTLATGAYNLTVTIPTSPTTFGTLSATSTLTSTASPIGYFAQPTLAEDATGGGTVSMVMPTGATEAYVNVVDFAWNTPANGVNNGPEVFYTLRFTASGSQALPDKLGPGATAGQTLYSGDPYCVYGVAFDYPANGASYPNSKVPNPAITNGSNGQADVSTSDTVDPCVNSVITYTSSVRRPLSAIFPGRQHATTAPPYTGP